MSPAESFHLSAAIPPPIRDIFPKRLINCFTPDEDEDEDALPPPLPLPLAPLPLLPLLWERVVLSFDAVVVGFCCCCCCVWLLTSDVVVDERRVSVFRPQPHLLLLKLSMHIIATVYKCIRNNIPSLFLQLWRKCFYLIGNDQRVRPLQFYPISAEKRNPTSHTSAHFLILT